MLYTVENDNFHLTVCSKGAELWDLRRTDEPEQPLLWDGAPKIWPWRAPVCFPWCGKLPDDWFEFGGKRYQGGSHGFVRELEHAIVERGPGFLTLRTEWDGDAAHWPWRFSFETCHRLTETGVTTTCTATNLSSTPMPAQLGFHPGLRCPFLPGRRTEDFLLRTERAEMPDGGSTLPLNRQTFANRRILIEHPSSTWAQLEDRSSGRFLRVDTTGFPFLLFWSPPELPEFVCIEPWMGRAGIGHDLANAPGSVLLEPEERLSSSLILTVG